MRAAKDSHEHEPAEVRLIEMTDARIDPRTLEMKRTCYFIQFGHCAETRLGINLHDDRVSSHIDRISCNDELAEL